jgi:hypothetical protein
MDRVAGTLLEFAKLHRVRGLRKPSRRPPWSLEVLHHPEQPLEAHLHVHLLMAMKQG